MITRRARGLKFGTIVLGMALALAAPAAQPASRPSTARGEWPTYGGDLASSKYSPLDQINAGNFARLRVAWRAKSPDARLSVTLPGGAEWTADPASVFAELNRVNAKRWRDAAPPFLTNFKATPLMVGGLLFVNAPTSVGAAYDAQTGAVRWVYNPKSYEAGTTTMSARWNQRGVAYWTDGKEERIYWGTSDGYLVAVDARTGRPVSGFGTNGRVDLMDGLPRATRGERDYLNALTYSVQSPPFVVGDTIFTPASISSLISKKEQIPGYIRAFDARTGKIRWTFKTIPSPGEFGNDTWEDDSWSYSGKVTVWSMMSADEELGLVYLPTNTVAPDYYGGHRPGDNLFAESVLALDIATGRPVWPIEERPVLPSDMPGERAARTQPFPTRPAPFEYQGVTVDDLIDFTPELRAMATKAVQGFRMGPLFTPPSLEGTIQRPGSGGGGNWSGAAVDPETGMLYVPSRQAWTVNRVVPPEPELKSNLRYVQRQRGSPTLPQGLPLFKPPYSRITAIDMNTGAHAWMTPAGNGNRIRDIPMLRPLKLPPVGGDTTLSGPLLTKTLLIYALTAGGTNDGPRLVAYDKRSGKELASTDLPGTAIGAPMTYLVDGRQHIALTVQPPGDNVIPELVALALP